jgi:carbon monoxide dehydrogenase subunit G
MDLTHRFTVPVPIDDAWAHFNDISSVAECFPGATVTSVEGDTFAGSVKVKLGPIALVYNGSGSFTEKDEATHRMVVDAKGKDKRGNGTAGAAVTMTMTEAGTSTDVEVVTDLAITGKPAQFGRGVMQDVSDKLLGQFVSCLEQRLTDSGSPAAAGGFETGASAPSSTNGGGASAPSSTSGEDDGTPVPLVEEGVQGPSRNQGAPTAASGGDSLNLGATVVPVLVKSYWKQALGALVVLVLIIWLITRL